MKLIVSLLTIALLVSLSTSCKKNEDVTQMNFSSPSKFGLLTSSRWAYGQKFKKESLTPVKNTNPNPEAQPNREHPYTQAITQDGKKLYIALTGSSSTPGSKISVFDVEKTKVIKRIEVGSSPMHLTLHPGGRFLVVLNRFSNFASVIDVKKDKVVSEIALDFYCQRIIFNRAGTKAYVSNRYLNQVFVVDIKVDGDDFEGTMQILGGFDDTPFLEHSQNKEVYNVINSSCGTMQCHANLKGNFYAGSDATKAYFSAMENATPGQPESSLLLKAVLSDDENGFADDMGGSNFHAGGLSILKKGGKKYSVIAQWIKKAQQGPGIPVGNFGSKPRSLALSTNERYLYVGNLGTQDISIIDLTKNIEIGGIYTQNVITDLNIFHDKVSSSDFLIALSLGLGFGAAKERDPVGGESLDSKNPAAQYTVHR
ncbi:MAG: YncE family protein, partial [Bacteriovoracaceae bacterium]|nr:YncE family protein [Bacteriovoracaceae bacterium]